MARTLALLLLGLPHSVSAAERPMTGKAVPEFAPLDRAVQKFMDRIDATAAAVAVSREGDLLYSRGYGWQDQSKSVRSPPDARFRLASLTKPITASAIKAAARDELLDLDARALPHLPLKHGIKPGDPRFADITIRHLLEHKSGWGTDPATDPSFQPADVKRVFRFSRPVTPADTIAYAFREPLAFAPGTKTAYSNIGFIALGRVLESVKKKPYADCLAELVLKAAGAEEIRPGASRSRGPKEVWHPGEPQAGTLEGADSAVGLVGSAPAVAKFLSAFWVTGELRTNNTAGGMGRYFGSIPGATVMVVQRRDGVNLAVLFNNRREKHYPTDNDDLRDRIDAALTEAIKE